MTVKLDVDPGSDAQHRPARPVGAVGIASRRRGGACAHQVDAAYRPVTAGERIAVRRGARCGDEPRTSEHQVETDSFQHPKVLWLFYTPTRPGFQPPKAPQAPRPADPPLIRPTTKQVSRRMTRRIL